METLYKNFKLDHIPDNEAHYFGLIESIIENVDRECIFVITRNPKTYSFRLSTASHNVVNSLIKQLNTINTAYGIKADFSKSMKSGNLFWTIQIF